MTEHDMTSSYLAEIHRLRTLVIMAADDLALIEQELVPVCQYVTDNNMGLRMALMEVRTLRATLEESGRPIVEQSGRTP